MATMMTPEQRAGLFRYLTSAGKTADQANQILDQNPYYDPTYGRISQDANGNGQWGGYLPTAAQMGNPVGAQYNRPDSQNPAVSGGFSQIPGLGGTNPNYTPPAPAATLSIPKYTGTLMGDQSSGGYVSPYGSPDLALARNMDIPTILKTYEYGDLVHLPLDILARFPNDQLLHLANYTGDPGGFLAQFPNERLIGSGAYAGSGFGTDVLSKLPPAKRTTLPGDVQSQLAPLSTYDTGAMPKGFDQWSDPNSGSLPGQGGGNTLPGNPTAGQATPSNGVVNSATTLPSGQTVPGSIPEAYPYQPGGFPMPSPSGGTSTLQYYRPPSVSADALNDPTRLYLEMTGQYPAPQMSTQSKYGARLMSASDGDLQGYAAQVAQQYGVDPGIFTRQLQQESGFQTGVSSSAGARGVAQFMPATGDSIARQLGVSSEQFWSDPKLQIQGAALLMSQNLQRYGGDYGKALAAYNAGPGAVDKYGGVPPYAETQTYVKNILGGGGTSAEGPNYPPPPGGSGPQYPGPLPPGGIGPIVPPEPGTPTGPTGPTTGTPGSYIPTIGGNLVVVGYETTIDEASGKLVQRPKYQFVASTARATAPYDNGGALPSGYVRLPDGTIGRDVNVPQATTQQPNQWSIPGYGQSQVDLTNAQTALQQAQAAYVAAQSSGIQANILQAQNDLQEKQRQFNYTLQLQQAQLAQQTAYQGAQIGLQQGQDLGYLGGNPTLQRQQFEAQQTGMYGGNPTQAALQQQADSAYKAAQIALQQGQYERANELQQAAQKLQERAQSFNEGVTAAGLTGTYNGQQTQAAQQQAFNQAIAAAGQTGYYGGQQTLQGQQTAANIEAQRAQTAMAQEQQRFTEAQSPYSWIDQARMARGQAPQGRDMYSQYSAPAMAQQGYPAPQMNATTLQAVRQADGSYGVPTMQPGGTGAPATPSYPYSVDYIKANFGKPRPDGSGNFDITDFSKALAAAPAQPVAPTQPQPTPATAFQKFNPAQGAFDGPETGGWAGGWATSGNRYNSGAALDSARPTQTQQYGATPTAHPLGISTYSPMATNRYQPPMSGATEARSLLQSDYAPPGLRQAFAPSYGGSSAYAAPRASVPYLSSQTARTLLPSERQGLDSLLSATGTNPTDYEQERQRLNQVGTPQRSTYSYAGRY